MTLEMYVRSVLTIRWSSPYRHNSTTANTDSPVKIIHNRSTLRSDVSVPGDPVSALAVALMLRRLPGCEERFRPRPARDENRSVWLDQRSAAASKDICPGLVGKISRVAPRRLAFGAN